MPAVARAQLKDSVATGHLCDATARILGGSLHLGGSLQNKVRIDGSLAAVHGDLIEPHTIKAGRDCISHLATITGTSSRVFIGGRSVSRIGDPADLGFIITGSSKVFIGN